MQITGGIIIRKELIGIVGADSGQLKYKLGHDGLGVVFNSGLGGGKYDVYATYNVVDDWGERITKVEIVLIDEDY